MQQDFLSVYALMQETHEPLHVLHSFDKCVLVKISTPPLSFAAVETYLVTFYLNVSKCILPCSHAFARHTALFSCICSSYCRVLMHLLVCFFLTRKQEMHTASSLSCNVAWDGAFLLWSVIKPTMPACLPACLPAFLYFMCLSVSSSHTSRSTTLHSTAYLRHPFLHM